MIFEKDRMGPMPKILMVDDEVDLELLARQKFRKEVQAGAFELYFANSGQDALSLIQECGDIDVVVSDVNMPEMDGLTLIETLQTLNPRIKSIVVSAYGDMETLRRAMNKGAYDFVTKPVDFEELKISIFKTLEHQQKHPLRNDLFIFNSYQQALMNAHSFKGIEISHHCHQGEKDWIFDAWEIDKKTIGSVMIHTVSNHLAEPLPVVVAHQKFKHRSCECPQTSLDTYLKDEKGMGVTTLIYGVFDKKSHTWTYAHNGFFEVMHNRQGNIRAILPGHATFMDQGDQITISTGKGREVLFKRT